jgi:hypothetical protein
MAAGVGQVLLLRPPPLPPCVQRSPSTIQALGGCLRLSYEDVWLRAADGVRLHSCSSATPPPAERGKARGREPSPQFPTLPPSLCLPLPLLPSGPWLLRCRFYKLFLVFWRASAGDLFAVTPCRSGCPDRS